MSDLKQNLIFRLYVINLVSNTVIYTKFFIDSIINKKIKKLIRTVKTIRFCVLFQLLLFPFRNINCISIISFISIFGVNLTFSKLNTFFYAFITKYLRSGFNYIQPILVLNIQPLQH